MEQITVRKLAAHLNNLVMTGHGDKLIVLSDDNEGNGYHGMFWLSTCAPDDVKAVADGLVYDSNETDPSKIVILG